MCPKSIPAEALVPSSTLPKRRQEVEPLLLVVLLPFPLPVPHVPVDLLLVDLLLAALAVLLVLAVLLLVALLVLVVLLLLAVVLVLLLPVDVPVLLLLVVVLVLLPPFEERQIDMRFRCDPTSALLLCPFSSSSSFPSPS